MVCACQDRRELITTPKRLKLLTLSIVLPLAAMLGTEFMSFFVPKWMSISRVPTQVHIKHVNIYQHYHKKWAVANVDCSVNNSEAQNNS